MRAHVGTPDLYFSQFGVQEHATPCCLVDEEIAGNHVQGQAGQGIRQGMGRDDRETRKDGETGPERSTETRRKRWGAKQGTKGFSLVVSVRGSGL